MASPATLNRAAFVDALTRYAPAFMYCLGVVLLLRRYLGLHAFVLCAAAAIGLSIAALADLLSRRRYDDVYFRAWLDLNNAGGGRIMAGDAGVPVSRLPGLSGKYAFTRLRYPALFLLVVALVPAPEPPDRGSSAGLLRAASAVGRDIDQAAAAALLNERQRMELGKQLERIRQLAQENNREAAAEALASIRERLDRAVAETYDAASETLEKAVALAQDMATAEAKGNAEAGRRAAQALADLRAELNHLDSTARRQSNAGEGDLNFQTNGADQNAFNPAPTGSGGAENRDGAGGDHADMLEALERYGRQLAEGDAGGTGGEMNQAVAREGGRSATDGQADADTGTGGKAAVASRRLRTATESLAALRERSTAFGVGSNGRGGEKGSGDGNGDARALSVANGDVPGHSAPGRGGISRGRGDAPLVLADGTRRDDRPLTYVPLTATGQSRFDGPEMSRSRSGIDDRFEPEPRQQATQSAVDAPRRLGAGATSVSPGPTRSRWVDAYFNNAHGQTKVF